LDATGAVRGRAAAGPHPGRAGPSRAGGARAGGADGDPGVALAGARGPVGRAHLVTRPRPRALGPSADRPRPGGARAGRGVGPDALSRGGRGCGSRFRAGMTVGEGGRRMARTWCGEERAMWTSELEGRWQRLAEEVFVGIKEWRLQHPKATFAEIERALDERL